MEGVLFWVFATLVVVGALGVIGARNPIHSAMSLVGTLFFLAAVFVLLRAHLVAGLQVLVYAGAIMVLFVFVIMLLSLSDDDLGQPRPTLWKVLGGGAAGGIAAAVAMAIFSGGVVVAPVPSSAGLTVVAHALYTDHVLAFEIIGVLLLVAIVGAVVVAKRRI